MYSILIADLIPESAIEILQNHSEFEVTIATGLDENALKETIQPYHGVIVRSATKITKAVIDAASHLKVIGRAGSGLDNIDLVCAKSKGIEVFNTPGSNSQAVAELTIGMLFALCRHLYPAVQSMKEHKWQKADYQGIELQNKTLGLVGFGQIGQRVGQMAAALGMHILVYKKNPMLRSPGYEFELVTFETLLSKSDFISLHVPKTKDTQNLFADAQFKKMRNSAFILNCARGGIIHEQDLIEALDTSQIGGAAIDVYETEPPVKYDLINHRKVIATPHIGGSTRESQQRVGEDIVNSIMNFLENKFVFISGK